MKRLKNQIPRVLNTCPITLKYVPQRNRVMLGNRSLLPANINANITKRICKLQDNIKCTNPNSTNPNSTRLTRSKSSAIRKRRTNIERYALTRKPYSRTALRQYLDLYMREGRSQPLVPHTRTPMTEANIARIASKLGAIENGNKISVVYNGEYATQICMPKRRAESYVRLMLPPNMGIHRMFRYHNPNMKGMRTCFHLNRPISNKELNTILPHRTIEKPTQSVLSSRITKSTRRIGDKSIVNYTYATKGKNASRRAFADENKAQARSNQFR